MPKIIDVQSTRYVGTWPDQLGDPTPGSTIGELKVIGEIARNAIEDLLRAKPEILNDRDLSDEGRRKKLAALADSKSAKLDELRPRVNDAMEKAREMEASLTFAAAPVSNQAAGAIRETEIRSWFRDLSESKRLSALRRATDENDFETLRAVYSGPPAMALIPANLRATIEETLLRGIDPERLQKIRDLRLAAQYADEALDLAKAAIIREGGIEPTLADRVRTA